MDLNIHLLDTDTKIRADKKVSRFIVRVICDDNYDVLEAMSNKIMRSKSTIRTVISTHLSTDSMKLVTHLVYFRASSFVEKSKTISSYRKSFLRYLASTFKINQAGLPSGDTLLTMKCSNNSGIEII